MPSLKKISTALRIIPFSICLWTVILLPGCSTTESQGGLATVLCWLRPSCLPSQQKDTTALPPPLSSPSGKKPTQALKVTAQRHLEKTCLTSAMTTVRPSKPYITVSYVEPTTNVGGQGLTNLAKTTIYHDLGKGLVKFKDIPATSPQGGGQIQEKVFFTLSEGTSIHVTICITATNTMGQER